jgi:3-methylfumaryl-CoA hydratase
MPPTAELDIAHLRGWIGRSRTDAEEVTADLVRRFCATFDEEPGAPLAGEPAPRLIHWCLAPPVALTGALDADGHPKRGDFLPPVPLPRRMWAGGALAYHDDIRIGDTVRRTSTIADVSMKEGRTGSLCFVTVQHEVDAGGRRLLNETQDIVYRGAEAGGPPAKAPTPAPEGLHRMAITPSPPLLFRYSALTFNAHRIHYDAPYVTQVEGYPGLVVHGPLQASLLLRFAARLYGAPPIAFTFRGQSPAFDTAPLLLNAAPDGDGMKLWTAQPGGPVAMSAEARW